jgi:hypothetical protein
MPLAWAFVVRAGDGNRTRAVSLGSRSQQSPLTCAYLTCAAAPISPLMTVDDRDRPL